MKTVYICIITLFIIISGSLCFAGYPPVISGDFSSGKKLYTDLLEGNEEEIIDHYYYQKSWLKYKKKLSVSEYYYLKYQFYSKEYEVKDKYNNICHNIWGNYTYQLSEKLRNRVNLSYKDKDYYDNNTKSYNSLCLKYTLDYDPDCRNDYQVYIQRQWNNYLIEDVNDNTRDKLSIEWEHEIKDNLEINTRFQIEKQQYSHYSQRSNKYNQNISVGFNYELQ